MPKSFEPIRLKLKKDYPRALKLLKDAKLTGDSVLMAKLLFATGDFPSALKQLEKIKENSDLELLNLSKKSPEIRRN